MRPYGWFKYKPGGRPRTTYEADRLFLGLFVAACLVMLVVFGAVAFVAWHFIQKAW